MQHLSISIHSLLKQLLFTNCVSLLIYLFVVFNNGLIGHVAVLLLIVAYAVGVVQSLLLLQRSLSTPLYSAAVPAVFTLAWVAYGLYSDIFFTGIHFGWMICLLLLSILVTIVLYKFTLK